MQSRTAADVVGQACSLHALTGSNFLVLLFAKLTQQEGPHPKQSVLTDLELQSIMPPNGTRGPSGGLQGVRCTPVPAKPPELLPQVINTLTEVHLQTHTSVSCYAVLEAAIHAFHFASPGVGLPFNFAPAINPKLAAC